MFYDKWTLDNGVRIVGEQLPELRSCTIGVWIGVGSSHESPDENGLSHFIEHMVFKGTEKRSAKQIALETDAVGAQVNAFTGKDCTCYYTRSMDEDIPLMLDVLSDFILHPIFTEEELSKERGVILEEIAMNEDSPEDIAIDLLAKAQFKGSLSRPILGIQNLIKNYSIDDIFNFWSKHYTGNNIVISIVGNYDKDIVLDIIKEKFGTCEKENITSKLYENSHTAQKLYRNKQTEQMHICMGFKGFKLGSVDSYTLSLVSSILGSGMSSRLFQRIREELGLVYSIYTYPANHPKIGALKLYAGTNPDNTQKVLDQINDVIKEFLNSGASKEEFASAKAQMRTGFVLGLESASSRMQRLGRGELLKGFVNSQNEILKILNDINMDDFNRVSHIVFDEPIAYAIVGPDADKYIIK